MTGKLMLNNPPKALILMVALIALTVLLALGRIDSGTGLGMIGTIVGYGIGNGVAAKHGDTVEPVLTARHNRDRRDGDGYPPPDEH